MKNLTGRSIILIIISLIVTIAAVYIGLSLAKINKQLSTDITLEEQMEAVVYYFNDAKNASEISEAYNVIRGLEIYKMVRGRPPLDTVIMNCYYIHKLSLNNLYLQAQIDSMSIRMEELENEKSKTNSIDNKE